MIVDCDRCAVRGAACAGCVVTALLDGGMLDGVAPVGGLDAAEARVVEMFEQAGFEVTVLTEPAAPPARQPDHQQPRPRRPRRRFAA